MSIKQIKNVTGFFLLFFCCSSAKAQVKDSPYSEIKGNIVISEFHSLEKASSTEGIFLNALLWMIENRETNYAEKEQENGSIEADYDKKQFTAEIIQTDKNSSSRYRCLLSVKVTDNIITILASNITYEAETNVIKLVKRLAFERLQPEKKPKHKEYFNEFATLHKGMVKQILEAAATPPPTVTHWAEIKDKDVVKGMNKSECLLAFGKPLSVQKQGNKEEWMYNTYTYVFFEDDVVTSLIK